MQKIFSGLLLFFIISISILSAQEITVSGTVTSSDGEQLPGVTIRQKGTSVGVISAFDGSYRISVPVDATLLFSNVGFTSQEKKVMGNSQLDVVLIESMAQLDEVVVTALGIERETRNLGYKVQRIDSDLVADIKSPNFVQNLAGKLAGVTVTQGATGVGSTSKIVVRGEASFTNNNPLFVIDGTPVNNNTIVNFTNDAAAGFQEVDFGNGAMEINPDDIASVNVLKGPGAAVLYGNRGSNGVIVITTKDGSEQEGLGVSFSSSTFIDRAFQLPQFQNEYGQGNSGAFEFVNGLGGGTNDNISYSWGPRTDQGLLISQFDSPVNLPDGSIVRGGDVAVHGGLPISQTPFVSYPDNLKNFYRTGTTLINSVALSNKTGRGSYRISFTDLASESIIPGVNLDRETLTARLKFKPVNELEVNATISYINTQSLNRPSSGYGSENVNYSLVAWGPRSLNIDRLKDYWQPGLQNLQQYSFNYTFFDNPYFILQENRNSLDRDRVFGNLSARYFFTPNLSLLLRSGLDYSTEQRAFRRAFSTNRFRNGAYAVHDVSYREVNTDFLLNYRVDVNKLGLDFYVGGNQMEQQASTKQTQALSLAQPGVFRLSNAASPLEIFDRSATKKVNSLYAMLNLNYGDFAFLEFT
ncbi:MAG: carboxypeptidase-like regulatory domain-containing protein, partial [Bacteroidota bacterium]